MVCIKGGLCWNCNISIFKFFNVLEIIWYFRSRNSWPNICRLAKFTHSKPWPYIHKHGSVLIILIITQSWSEYSYLFWKSNMYFLSTLCCLCFAAPSLIFAHFQLCKQVFLAKFLCSQGWEISACTYMSSSEVHLK